MHALNGPLSTVLAHRERHFLFDYCCPPKMTARCLDVGYLPPRTSAPVPGLNPNLTLNRTNPNPNIKPLTLTGLCWASYLGCQHGVTRSRSSGACSCRSDICCPRPDCGNRQILIDGTDRWTDVRALGRYIDHAGSVSNPNQWRGERYDGTNNRTGPLQSKNRIDR